MGYVILLWHSLSLPYNYFGYIGISIGKSENSGDFSESLATCGLKDGRCRQLIELRKVSEY